MYEVKLWLKTKRFKPVAIFEIDKSTFAKFKIELSNPDLEIVSLGPIIFAKSDFSYIEWRTIEK